MYGGSRSATAADELICPIRLDVTDENSIRDAVSEVYRREARIDLLINNAGVAVAGSLEDTSVGDAKALMDVNFFGAFRLIQAVLPVMRFQRAGLIINVSSLGGAFGLPYQSIYSASKFALEGMSESLRYEVRDYGIDVVVIEPGDVRTNITRNRVRPALSFTGSPYIDRFETVLKIIESEERNGVEPEAVANLVLNICESGGRRARYSCGRISQRAAAWARRCLPAGLFEKLISSFYGIARDPSRRLDSDLLTKSTGAS
jgi:short-subunit dehydrogenase